MPPLKKTNKTNLQEVKDESMALRQKTNKTDSQVKDESRSESFANAVLKGTLFIGSFSEQRYVQSLDEYRYMVSISSSETQLIDDLKVVLRQLKNAYGSTKWIGITAPDNNKVGAPPQHCFWIQPKEMIPIGSYWFKIRKVNFTDKEIAVKLKKIRVAENSQDLTVGNNQVKQELTLTSINKSFNSMKTSFLKETNYFLSNVFTFENSVSLFRFFAILMITLIAGFVKLVTAVSDFLLRLMHEVSLFIKILTPFLLGCVGLVEKVIGGFYLLISIMWRDFWTRPPRDRVRVYLEPRQRRALTYR